MIIGMARLALLLAPLLPTPGLAWAQEFTQAEAVQRARDFCKAIGAPVGASPSVEYPARDPSPTDILSARPRWRVSFRGQASVEVLDGSGEIAGYFGYTQPGDNESPPGPAIAESEAIERAAAALSAAGPVDELAFYGARLEQAHVPPLASTHNWWVRWIRHFGGIPYRYQEANVGLDAQTGAVKGLGRVFRSEAPRTATFAMSGNQAAGIAVAKLPGAGLDPARITNIQAQVVQPNTYWQPGGSEGAFLPGARVAWVCWFDHAASGRSQAVWVDAETGEVIGGSSFGLRLSLRDGGRDQRKPPTLRDALAAAETVSLYARDSRRQRFGPWQARPLAVLSNERNASLLDDFRTRTRFRVLPARRLARWRLVFSIEGRPDFEASYYPETGLLGSPGDWAVASSRFNAWARRLSRH